MTQRLIARTADNRWGRGTIQYLCMQSGIDVDVQSGFFPLQDAECLFQMLRASTLQGCCRVSGWAGTPPEHCGVARLSAPPPLPSSEAVGWEHPQHGGKQPHKIHVMLYNL